MLRLNENYVKLYFAHFGCKLLDQYLNAKTSMKYRCKCGKISSTTFSKFQIGDHSCRKCGHKKGVETKKLEKKLMAETTVADFERLLDKLEERMVQQ